MRFEIESKNYGHLMYSANIERGHFSLTGSGYKVGGCLHDELKGTQWEKYVKWHLFDWGKGPIHYVANALYWFGYTGQYTDPKLDVFLSHIVWGESKLDTKYQKRKLRKLFNNYSEENKATVIKFLQNRLPSLVRSFERDMVELGVLEVKK